MNLTDAIPIARGLLERIQRYCDRAAIAGSIRRYKSEVKDVEIVAIPRWRTAAAADLFGSETKVNDAKKIGLPCVEGQLQSTRKTSSSVGVGIGPALMQDMHPTQQSRLRRNRPARRQTYLPGSLTIASS